jgi:hypothetical protein
MSKLAQNILFYIIAAQLITRKFNGLNNVTKASKYKKQKEPSFPPKR